MPTAAPRPCGHPSCPELAHYRGRCKAHQNEDGRAGSSERGYDWNWRRLRDLVLSEEPLCRECLKAGIIEATKEVDHIIPIRLRPDLRLDRSNLQGLCKHHHALKTLRERG